MLKDHWFLPCVVSCIAFAAVLPDIGRSGGFIHTEYYVDNSAVVCAIFLLSGLSLQIRVLRDAIFLWKAHLVIQVFSFIVLPVFGVGLVALMLKIRSDEAVAPLIVGVLVAFSMPTTISSNVIMTGQARGNEALALINSAFGNLLGAFLSPILILGELHVLSELLPSSFETASQASIALKLLGNLGWSVVLPLFVGVFLNFFFADFIKKMRQKIRSRILSSVLLLVLVYATFCNAFAKNSGFLEPAMLVVVICLIFALYPLIMALVFTSKLFFSRRDTVAIVFCGSTKTLSLGVPVVSTLFSPQFSAAITVPLLCYHASQLVWGSLATPSLKKWVESS